MTVAFLRRAASYPTSLAASRRQAVHERRGRGAARRHVQELDRHRPAELLLDQIQYPRPTVDRAPDDLRAGGQIDLELRLEQAARRLPNRIEGGSVGAALRRVTVAVTSVPPPSSSLLDDVTFVVTKYPARLSEKPWSTTSGGCLEANRTPPEAPRSVSACCCPGSVE